MKAAIQVADRKERDAIKIALEDPSTRAFVITIGALLQLQSHRARERVLKFVIDHMEEQDERKLTIKAAE